MDERQSEEGFSRKEEVSVERKGPQRVTNFYSSNTILQSEIGRLATLQAAAWQAEKAVQRAMMQLEGRIKAGCVVEHGPLYFDHELGMVRSRKEKTG